MFSLDALGGQTVMTFHDGSTRTNVYDEAGDVIAYTDENGSKFTNTFDVLGRKTNVAIAPAAGVADNAGSSVPGTVAQAFTFDGLSRMTDSTDTSSSGNVAEVQMFYDSLARVLEESQLYAGLATPRYVTNTAFASYPASGFTFPQGRVLANTFDALYRRTLAQDVTNSVDVAAWQFFGPSRVAEVTLGSGLICTWMNNTRTHSTVLSQGANYPIIPPPPPVPNPDWGDQSSDRLGYDGAGRPITKRYLAGGINGFTFGYNNPTSVVGFTTEYDLASNKFFERPLHCAERGHLYEPFSNGAPTGGYDSLDRLRQYQRGTLSTSGGFGNAGGGSITTPIALPNSDTQRTYDLDGLGNWRRTDFTLVPTSGPKQTVAEVRQHNGLNEITRIQDTNSITGTSQKDFTYDGAAGASNGNLSDDGTRSYVWDALNRLMQVNRVSDGAVIGQYVYDALNRRIRKTIPDLGDNLGGLTGNIPAGTTDCIYSGWRCVEERNPFGGGGSTDTPTIQYIWGIYLDELLQQFNIVAINGFSPNVALYPLQDLLYRTTGLADSSGTVREAYDTDAYGNTLIFRNGSSPGTINWLDTDTQVDHPTCTFIFTGQRFDSETQIYYYKERYCLPSLGRFAVRDPLELQRTANRPLGLPRLPARSFGILDGFGPGVGHVAARRHGSDAGEWHRPNPSERPGGDINLYGYCGGSPAGAVDPSGLAATQTENDLLQCRADYYACVADGKYTATKCAYFWGDCAAKAMPPFDHAMADDSAECDQYKCDDTYAGANARCFCKCAGNSDCGTNLRGRESLIPQARPLSTEPAAASNRPTLWATPSKARSRGEIKGTGAYIGVFAEMTRDIAVIAGLPRFLAGVGRAVGASIGALVPRWSARSNRHSHGAR
jgi:RHS repeat-associated protein